jgi:hypothetical protein
MFSPTRTALYLAIGAMAFAANEANAGCKRIPAPNGTLVCASWIPGSEICQVKFDHAPPDDPDATVRCSITGFRFIGEGNQVCLTGTLPPGTLICGEPPPPTTPTLGLTTASTPAGPKEGEGNDNDNDNGDVCDGHGHGHGDGHGDNEGDAACFSGVPVIIPDTTIFFSDVVHAECDKHGICRATAEVLPPDGGPVIDFTADEFLGITETCNSGTPGGEGCPGGRTLYQRCTLNGDTYDCTVLDGRPPFCAG